MEKVYLNIKSVSIIAFASLMLLCSCSSAVITPQGYEMVQAGSNVEFIESAFGSPYEVNKADSGIVEYTYIGRVPVSPGMIDQTTYKFYIRDSKVINKSKTSESGQVNINLM